MTDTKIGGAGRYIGFANFVSLSKDSVFWLSVFNTIFYTVTASIVKFAIGLYLALLLNERLPFKSMIRAIVLLPFVVPTVLSAIAFWWIYDSQFSIISWVLIKAGLITRYIDFLGDPWNARLSVVAANIWRGVPFVAITLLAGLQTISPSLYEAATLDGATDMQRFRHITLPMLSPIIAVVMTFSVLITFTDFQLIYTHHAGRADQCHPSDGDAVVPARHHRRQSRRGRGDLERDDPVPGRSDPAQLLRAAAPPLAAGREGLTMTHRRRPKRRHGLSRELPAAALHGLLSARPVHLRPAVPVLLDGDHDVQAGRGDVRLREVQSVLDRASDARAHQEAVVRHRLSALDVEHRDRLGRLDLHLARSRSVCAAYAIERLRFKGSRYVGLAIFLAYLVPPSILFIPLAAMVFQLGLFDGNWR